MEKFKKVYKMGDVIDVADYENIMEIAKGVVKKGLKVIEASGNKHATTILEGRDNDTFQDLTQNVAMIIYENNYTIVKDCYKSINKVLNDKKRDVAKVQEIVLNDTDNLNDLEKLSYINYIKEQNGDFLGDVQEQKGKISIENLKLTTRQLEILNIYSKIGSERRAAELLGVTRQGVQNALKTIRKKALATCINM